MLRFDSHTFRILAKIEHKRTAADDDDDEAEKKPTAGAAFLASFKNAQNGEVESADVQAAGDASASATGSESRKAVSFAEEMRALTAAKEEESKDKKDGI